MVLYRIFKIDSIPIVTYKVLARDCNPGIPAVFANLESQDWQRFNPVISGLQKLAKIVLFRVLG